MHSGPCALVYWPRSINDTEEDDMTKQKRHADAAKTIYFYERSVERPPEDSLFRGERVPMEGRSILKLSLNGALRERELFEYASKCKDYLRSGAEVDACLSDRVRRYTSLMVRRDTPEVLQEVGLNDAPWMHGIAHARDEVHPKDPDGIKSEWHGLRVSQLKRLPELLEEPCVILDNRKNKNGIVCMVDELDEDGLPIIVPIDPFPKRVVYQGMNVEGANFAKSMYGHSCASWLINTAAEEDRVLFIDHEKTRRLMSCAGLQLSRACMSLPDKVIIRQSAKIVNTSKSLGERPRIADLEEERRGMAAASKELNPELPSEQNHSQRSIPGSRGRSAADCPE